MGVFKLRDGNKKGKRQKAKDNYKQNKQLTKNALDAQIPSAKGHERHWGRTCRFVALLTSPFEFQLNCKEIMAVQVKI